MTIIQCSKVTSPDIFLLDAYEIVLVGTCFKQRAISSSKYRASPCFGKNEGIARNRDSRDADREKVAHRFARCFNFRFFVRRPVLDQRAEALGGFLC
jgi:hypothetical protein